MIVGRQMAGTFAEFFAGVGLMRIGLEQAGWDVRFANDIDPAKQEMYSGHFRETDSCFVLADIHDLNADEIPTVDLATASFPCTDLSLAGARAGLSGSQSSAFWGFVSILKQLGSRSPTVVLLENVPAFLSSNCGRDFVEAMTALNQIGYTVDPFIINASHWVPQSRQRLFVVAKRVGSDSIREARRQPVFYESEIRPRALAAFILDHPEITWDVHELPTLPTRSRSLHALLDDCAIDANQWWTRDRTAYLISQLSDRHSRLLKHLQEQNRRIYATVFRRVRSGRTMAEMRTDGIAGCLRTPKGGSAKQIVLRIEGRKISARYFSPSECAHLMGAPEYRITVGDNQALFGFGDAVCVDVVKWIAENYLERLVPSHSAIFKPKRGYSAAVAST